MEFTEVEKIFFSYAEEIARSIYNKNESLVINPKLDETTEKEFIEKLIAMDEIENVIPEEDGLHIFFAH